MSFGGWFLQVEPNQMVLKTVKKQINDTNAKKLLSLLIDCNKCAGLRYPYKCTNELF